MNDLSVTFLGKKLINPLLLASAPPAKDKKSIIAAFEAGWAGAITKSVSKSVLQDKNPRIGHIRYHGRMIASQNYEMGSIYSINTWKEWVDEIKESYPDRFLGVSLFGGPEPEEWKYLAHEFKATKADCYELNFSCPHADHEGKGAVIGQNPNLCALLTKTVKEEAGGKKILVKHTYLSHPNEGYISKKCISAGADGFAAINTIAGLSPIDIYSFKPALNTGGKTTHGGISGEAIRPFARASIANISKSIDCRKNQVSAIGGISEDAASMVEFILLGATTLQVCTEVMNKGYKIINPMLTNLSEYIQKVGADSIEQLIGKSLDSITGWFDLDTVKRAASINYDSCTNCHSCIHYCNYDALKINENKIMVDENSCDGCGSCSSACQSSAITLKPLKE